MRSLLRSLRTDRLVAQGLFAALAGINAPIHAGDTVRTGGDLGAPVSYLLSGNPNVFYAFVPSLNSGPIPLSILDPSSLQLMEVGLDLQLLWKVSLLDPLGHATVTFPLPNVASLQGLTLRAQWFEFTIGGSGLSVLGALPPVNVVTMGGPGTAVLADGNQPDEIYGHTANALADGRVASIGGSVEDTLGNFLFRAEIHTFDPQEENFSLTAGRMAIPRAAHTSTRLTDDTILIVGGTDGGGNVLTLTEIWDPVTDVVTQFSGMNFERVQHTATLMSDGRVLVSGGLKIYDFSDIITGLNSAEKSLEIFDPSTGAWTLGPDMPKGRVGHRASLLPDGRVLITGGLEVGTFFGVPVPELSNDCQIYDPVSNALTQGPSFNGVRALHHQITLSDGSVLVGGGFAGDLLTLNFIPQSSTRRYSPTSNTWTDAGDLSSARGLHTFYETAAGKVVVVGGVSTLDLAQFQGLAVTATEEAGSSLLSWVKTDDMSMPRDYVTVTPYGSPARLLIQGRGDNGVAGTIDTTSEIYIP